MNSKQKIKVWAMVSLDGFVSAMDGDIDLLLDYPRPKEATDYGYSRFFEKISCGVMSGMFYSVFDSRDLWPLAGKPCHIISSKQFTPPKDRNIRFIMSGGGNGCNSEHGMLDCLRAMQREESGDIWLVGCKAIITPCMEHDMVDEITVNVIPITLGNGIPLFNRNGMERQWKLKNSRVFDNGVVQMRYTINRLVDENITG